MQVTLSDAGMPGNVDFSEFVRWPVAECSDEGTPVQLLKEGEGTGAVVAVRRVNELDFYSLGAKDLAEKVGLTLPKSRAVVNHLALREDPEFFKEIRIGSMRHARYSSNAIKKMKGLCLESGGNWFWRLSERVEFCGGQAARSRVSSAIS